MQNNSANGDALKDYIIYKQTLWYENDNFFKFREKVSLSVIIVLFLLIQIFLYQFSDLKPTHFWMNGLE